MEKETFEKEVRRLRPKLFSYVNNLLHDTEETEDVLQDAMLKLWFFRDRLDCYNSIDAVAFIITKRLIINRQRDSKTYLTLKNVENIIDEEVNNSVEEFSDEVIQALNSLPNVEQAVMRMKHIEGMENEEIAALISSTPGAVRTALSRARKKIRDRFLRH